MSATIVSFAQFQESRRRRQAAVRVPAPTPGVEPDRAPDDQPLAVSSDAPAPGPAPRQPSPQRQ